MATPEKEDAAQERRKSGKFASGYTDEMLYELVGNVTVLIDPHDPASVSQPRFDKVAPGVAVEQGWPKPPSARAIAMRLGKAWQLIKDEATGPRNIQQTLARADGVKQATWLNESHVYYALRRVHLHLKKRENETLYPHEYHRGRYELIAAAKRLRHHTVTEELLPTRGQLIWLYGGEWNEALRLARIPETPAVRRGHPLLKLVEHFYETTGSLPRATDDIRAHGRMLKVSCPHPEGKVETMIDELIADRAKRGLTTPDDGPEEGARLTPVEIAALIHQAPPKQNYRRWTEDEVIDAFAEMVEEFEGQKINAALYTQHRVEHGWPSNPSWQKHGRFRDLVEKGRQRVRDRRRRQAA